MAKPREGYHDFFVSIPEPLWERLKADAAANDRTVTAQLLRILKATYPDATKPAEAEQPAPKKPRKKKGE